jgi:hypothetical protein
MTLAYSGNRQLRLQQALLVLTGTLFVASFLSWRGVSIFGMEMPFRPVSSLWLSGALLLQSVGYLVARRSLALSIVVVAVTFGCLIVSATTAR